MTDMISREAALMDAVWAALKSDATDLAKQQRILQAFRALPAVQVAVKPLVWENFGNEYWAKSLIGTYYVRERNRIWKTTIDTKSGETVVYEYGTDAITPDDFLAAKASAQADYETRIRAALTVQPTDPMTDPRAVALVEALRFIAEARGTWQANCADAALRQIGGAE